MSAAAGTTGTGVAVVRRDAPTAGPADGTPATADGVRERVELAVERAIADLPEGEAPGSVTVTQVTLPSASFLVAVAAARAEG